MRDERATYRSGRESEISVAVTSMMSLPGAGARRSGVLRVRAGMTTRGLPKRRRVTNTTMTVMAATAAVKTPPIIATSTATAVRRICTMRTIGRPDCPRKVTAGLRER